MITDLREGDIVRIYHEAWPASVYVEGPLFKTGGGLQCGSINLESWKEYIEVTVVSRVPRFYVNADRGPAVGDVALTSSAYPSRSNPWFFTTKGWFHRGGVRITGDMPTEGNVLVWDAVKLEAPPLPEEKN